MQTQWLRTSMRHKSPSRPAVNFTKRKESPLQRQDKVSKKQ